MAELGQLESRWQDFDKRKVIVIASSVEGLEATKEVQDRFPHLLIVSDKDHKLTNATAVLHRGSAQDGGDTSAPTTFLIDSKGTVRGQPFRPDRVTRRLSPDELLAEIDREMPAE